MEEVHNGLFTCSRSVFIRCGIMNWATHSGFVLVIKMKIKACPFILCTTFVFSFFAFIRAGIFKLLKNRQEKKTVIFNHVGGFAV